MYRTILLLESEAQRITNNNRVFGGWEIKERQKKKPYLFLEIVKSLGIICLKKNKKNKVIYELLILENDWKAGHGCNAIQMRITRDFEWIVRAKEYNSRKLKRSFGLPRGFLIFENCLVIVGRRIVPTLLFYVRYSFQ